MSLDFIAYPLGKFLLFIYNIAFQNYGLAIIIFTIIVRLAMLPLTLKQYRSSAKMQELQPLINDIQRKYKNDREKMNEELMKLYQEHNYNPAGGCLPMFLQFPIIITLYWVIVQPLKFMLNKSADAINKIVEAAAKGVAALEAAAGTAGAVPRTVEEIIRSWGNHKEIRAMNFFNEHQELLSEVSGCLDKSELIDFKSFLGLHLGETATYNFSKIVAQPEVYVPLLILVILATATTYFSGRLAMPKTSDSSDKAAGCTSNSMVLMGPVMTLMFSFQMPAGIILYWMSGYVVAIIQQLYINKYVLKKKDKPSENAVDAKSADNADNKDKTLKAGEETDAGEPVATDKNESAGKPEKGAGTAKPRQGKAKEGGQKKGKKKKGGKKK
ncbi:MAG: YidC/Oxa1 family membrane protein insertase [Acetivibrionales bacterium]|jgi:YidC/Oxa1 family membrane protein insertase